MAEQHDTDSRETLRRRFLTWTTFILGGIASAAMGIPLVGYFLSIIVKPQPDEWIDLGAIGQFPLKETRLKEFELPRTQPWDGATKKASAYVRYLGKVTVKNDKGESKEQHNFQIFAINCAHLGCPVAWFPQSGLFMCPCHGGVYYEDGSKASGPPPRGLFEYEDFKVDDQGKLWIKGGHLPTLQHTFPKPSPGAKA